MNLDEIRDTLLEAQDQQLASDEAALDMTRTLGNQQVMYANDARGTLYSGMPTWQMAQIGVDTEAKRTQLRSEAADRRLAVWNAIRDAQDQIAYYNRAAAALTGGSGGGGGTTTNPGAPNQPTQPVQPDSSSTTQTEEQARATERQKVAFWYATHPTGEYPYPARIMSGINYSRPTNLSPDWRGENWSNPTLQPQFGGQ